MKLNLLTLYLNVSVKSAKIGPEKVHASAELADGICGLLVESLHLFSEPARAINSHQANKLHIWVV